MPHGELIKRFRLVGRPRFFFPCILTEVQKYDRGASTAATAIQAKLHESSPLIGSKLGKKL